MSTHYVPGGEMDRTIIDQDVMHVSAEHRERQWANGWPWCTTCHLPALSADWGSRLAHSTDAFPRGVPEHLDTSGHVVALRDWAAARDRGSRRPPGSELTKQPARDADGTRLRHRRGRWTYVHTFRDGPRWRLDGTGLELEHQPGRDPHWTLHGPGAVWVPVDRFLDGAMSWVEAEVFGGSAESFAVTARAALVDQS